MKGWQQYSCSKCFQFAWQTHTLLCSLSYELAGPNFLIPSNIVNWDKNVLVHSKHKNSYSKWINYALKTSTHISSVFTRVYYCSQEEGTVLRTHHGLSQGKDREWSPDSPAHRSLNLVSPRLDSGLWQGFWDLACSVMEGRNKCKVLRIKLMNVPLFLLLQSPNH